MFQLVHEQLLAICEQSVCLSVVISSNASCRHGAVISNFVMSENQSAGHHMNNLPIIGLIKFNVLTSRESGSYISSRELPWDDHVKIVLDPERLKFRFRILSECVLQQIDQQTIRPSTGWFQLIVVTTNLLPVYFKESLQKLCKQYSWLKVVERTPDQWIGSESLILDGLKSMTSNTFGEKPFFSFRLDDDDLLPIDYFEKVQPYITTHNVNKFLTFKNGAKILWDEENFELCNFERVDKPFIAIGLGAVCAFDKNSNKITSEIKSVFIGMNHYDISKTFKYIIDDTELMFIWSHQKFQDTYGRFKSVSFSGKWTSPPNDIYAQLAKFPSLFKYIRSNNPSEFPLAVLRQQIE